MYKIMILPYFDYGDVIYKSSVKVRYETDALYVLAERYETDALYVLAECPKLQARRHAHVVTFMFKQTALVDLLDNREIRTRAHDAPFFKVKIPSNEAYKRSVEFSRAVMWRNRSL